MPGHYLEKTRPYDAPMGFNPFRTQRTTFVDVAIVAGTILVTVGLVLWAALSA